MQQDPQIGLKTFVLAWLMALGAIFPAGASAQSSSPVDALSLENAIRLAHEYNPEYRIQASNLETLAWRRREVWASFVPSATLSNFFGYTAGGERQFGDLTLGIQPALLSSRYNLGLSLNLSGASFLQPSVVSAQENATRAYVDGASAGLLEEVTRSYLGALQADEELEQAFAEVERTRAHVSQAEAQVAVGAATPLDIRRAETQEGQAEVQLLQAQNSVVTTRLALMQILGTEVSREVTLTTRFEIFESNLDTADLLELSFARNPALLASQSEVAAARTQTRMAQTQYLPSVSISANWSGSVFQADRLGPLVSSRLQQVSGQFDGCVQNNRILGLLGDSPADCGIFDVSDPAVESAVRAQVTQGNQGFPFGYDSQPISVSANVSVPLFTGFSRQLQIEEARVAADNAERQVMAEELRLRAEVETALRTVQTALRTAELQAGIRETTVEELRLAQERFRLGLASSIEVADAQANLSQAERDEISAVYDFHLSFATLESLVGVSLRE